MAATKTSDFIVTSIKSFEKCFSRKASYELFVRFVLSFLLGVTRRTVTGICNFWPDDKKLASYYSFLGRSPWSIETLAKVLFYLIIKFVIPLQSPQDQKRLILVADTTSIEKSGRKMEGAGTHYAGAPGRTIYGHELMRLSVMVKINDMGIYELPFLTRLYVRKKDIENQKLKTEYHSRETLLPLLVKQVQTLTKLPIILVADSLYSGIETLKSLDKSGITIISRRQNTDKKGAVGWNSEMVTFPKAGKLKTLNGKIWFDKIDHEELMDYSYVTFNRRFKTVKAKRYDAIYLYRYPTPVTIVVLLGENGDRIVLVCTSPYLSTSDIIYLYRSRFSIEFGFRDSKQYIGLEDYQVRRIRKIEKHLFLSHLSYCLAKIAFILDKDLREKCLTLFYQKRRSRLPMFSMMRMKEELQLMFLDVRFRETPLLLQFPKKENTTEYFPDREAAA